MQAALVDVSIHSFIGYDMMFTDLKKIWDPILWPLTFCSYSKLKNLQPRPDRPTDTLPKKVNSKMSAYQENDMELFYITFIGKLDRR